MSAATLSSPSPAVIGSSAPANGGSALFTCNSCGVGFPTPDMQRRHMKTDWHRYNLKRRVATLPPISAEIFAERVLQQMDASRKNEEKLLFVQICRVCGNKRFTSAGAYENHLSSSRHKDNLKRAEQLGLREDDDAESNLSGVRDHSPDWSVASSTFSLGEPVQPQPYHAFGFRDSRVGGGGKKSLRRHKTLSSAATSSVAGDDLDSVIGDGVVLGLSDGSGSSSVADDHDAEDEDEDIDSIIARKLQNAVKLPINACIFCSAQNFGGIEATVAHMQRDHGLFIPERDYLVDLEGLLTYLSEKVSIGNACLYCSFIGRSLNSVRDHMVAKQHCKIPYDTEDERLELSSFYDFSSSYPDDYEEEDDWDDVASEEEGAEEDAETVTDVSVVSRRRAEGNLVLDPTGLELSLPLSRLRIGHRSLARYYRQSLRPSTELREGQGTVIAASSRQVLATVSRDSVKERFTKKDWRDQRDKQNRDIRREQRYINQQKHYRDPMLGG
ncbi:Rei1p [Lipomyces tetrasporus]|uniref:Rei1p n=1 Tax=Lipomyces tetrasporus TaxID=54092 RepID=A0AAD7QV39_9ASCO|nr:Rei1p [Lipomyces tetrasporus]KAJ8101883.1 Rei1p [Lipomyces tetrasporus]